ncbi:MULTISPECIES: DUF2716 domain-containing protein [Bacillus]|uniref:DUF2716 domain-containing protein n=1 Tax=Bacillus TaxID=1386 RepID=UPI000402E6F5|nr:MULTISPECIES: DUF2716 domain-containing protein [Bacillus cereus group]OTY61885.1 sugar epimerase [Bacillus thuringiensis serovar graciosensis]AXY09311.1 DUF2716 domain-containing protein [Bacillus thuringiensis LM1212]KXY75724.1 sugar epimerase [Bacillus cereus]MBG9935404.1 bifunctional nucleotide sugar epimerase hydrolase [Bacillus tropicus]MED2992592.1 DUF2716 domain-containing protein [Bacillus tropicus]
MKNWMEFTDKEDDRIWNKLYSELEFSPSVSTFPSFKVPSPFITYNISHYFGESVDLDVYDDLEDKALQVFKENTASNEYIMALDWQHECYWVNPHLEFERNEFDEWIIPIFPNGDYYFFIQKDFNWGYLGHPWEKSITIFGKGLIESFERNKPEMFQNILRQG